MAHGSMEASNVNPFVESKQVLPIVFHCKSVKECLLSHAKCPFLWTSKQAYDGIGNGGLEVENIFILIKSYCAEGQLK